LYFQALEISELLNKKQRIKEILEEMKEEEEDDIEAI